MKLKTTDELKHVPFEMYASVLARAERAEAARDAMRRVLVEVADYSNDLVKIARAALDPSPTVREKD
jgi:hypothetical protein